jgi:hypothetical protein
MDKKIMGLWIMFYEVQKLIRDGLSYAAIGSALALDPRTVSKYALMSEEKYALFLAGKETRTKILNPYEDFVKIKLQAHPSVKTAQMHDWLKEHYADFPKVPPKTVYNFVLSLRQKYNIPLQETPREYFIVEELPYGQQAQADFGQYILRSSDNRRKRVHFFVMMLSRSRMKFLQFSEIPFTTKTAIDAHEEAFKFFCGITKEIVYDQDRLFLTEERMGELLLTQMFKEYVFEQNLRLYFCRKSDPESKGKVENVVKFVKNNFLHARGYFDIETLQVQAFSWLERTGNGMAHSTTRKLPAHEWEIEKPHLTPWVPVKILSSYLLRAVRKDNTFSYLGSFYSVPQGTFKNKDTSVQLWLKEGALHVHQTNGTYLCKHMLAERKGTTVINNDHKRDKSLKVKELLKQTAEMFEDASMAAQYFEMIREIRPRYLRDQVQAIQTTITGKNRQLLTQVLERCIAERYLGAVAFKELLALYETELTRPKSSLAKIILLDHNSTKKADIQPDKSDINAYEDAFKNN